MGFSISIFGRSGVNKLNASLTEYAKWTKQSTDVILVQAARQVRWDLDQGFTKHRWKGDAWAEAAARRRNHSGTHIRPSTIARYGALNASKVSYRGKWCFTSDPALLELELKRRTRGKGIVGISWRLLSWRYSKQGPKLVPNRVTKVQMGTVRNVSGELGELAEVKQAPGYVRLQGFTPGMGEIDRRYGIVDKATSGVAEKIKWRTLNAMRAKNTHSFPRKIK